MTDETGSKQQAASEVRDVYEEASHALPSFVNWMIDNALLPLLLIAEGYLMGSLFTRGWVGDIEQPLNWGAYHGVGVVAFFFAGAATAGLNLRASVAFAGFLQRRKIGFAFMNFITVVGLSAAEVWSSLEERSFHLLTSPADKTVLAWLHAPANTALTPSLIVTSVVLPFTTLTYGFSQQRKARVSQADLADDEAAWEQRIAKARHMNDLHEVQAEGARGLWKTLRGKKTKEEPTKIAPLANGQRAKR